MANGELNMTHPRQVDDWTVERELGRGDFATVYEVTGQDRRGALKLCTTHSEPTLERLEVEQDALRLLDHRAIPTLLGSGEYDSLPYFVMSLAPGSPLKDLIEDNHKLGRLYGDIETLQLLSQLLSALAHVHESGFVHRDIKDANVIHDPIGMKLALIDFGFCKQAGTSQMRSSDSFWRVGAARFSPPAKLANPGFANPSHDVFAVGVMAYRMLSGEFPWSVTRYDDVAALRVAQLNQPLEPLSEKNSYVLPRVSRWVADLLELDDARRPTATEALARAEAILSEVNGSNFSLLRGTRKIDFPFVIRDPIHRDIRITEYEYKVLNTPEMQRLRSIKQLGLTNLVYPGAEHSRLSHSLGCLARTEQILHTIEERDGLRIEPEIRLTARLYALTHDITHIPFGHTLEDELGIFERHDQNRPRAGRLLGKSTSQVGKLLKQSESGRLLLDEFIEGEELGSLHSELVSSVAGADVLDYIDRDSYFCGLQHQVDSAIFRQFRLHATPNADDSRLISLIGGKYGLRIDREFAVETILKERYALFLKVYTHSAKIAASALLGKALFHATEGSRRLREEDIEQLGDETLLQRLVTSQKPVVTWSASQVRNRILPRGVYRAVLLPENSRDQHAYNDKHAWLEAKNLISPHGRHKMEQELARRAGLEPQQVIVYCPPKAPGYRQVEHWVSKSREESPTRQGSELGGDIARKHLGLWEMWVFIVGVRDNDKRTKLADHAQDIFGMQNLINVYRRQGRLF
ncbi:protein kinase [Amycolatopsis sp. OK19-0408]|uniref:Protein kinase n=1 Tax=Amycolatopsis iheyensis TaxID=2945988 RepID=A0A9X2SKM8_9PSEU|nr:protein kinase [Amycolatopsis iheyensis]MCR6484016.1 protein kinase [Amycolatopsis iheyensis]